jgi:hypothetical protein
MPQWLSGVLIGVIVAWATQALQTYFKRHQYRYEKLMDHYASFVAAVIDDIDRARTQASAMLLGSQDQDYTELAKQLDDKRHSSRLQLLRLSFQIRLLESEPDLAGHVDSLAKGQPFMAFPLPPRWHKGNFNERFDEFQNEICKSEKLLGELVRAVLAKRMEFGSRE